MVTGSLRARVLRDRSPGHPVPVTNMELFFDLVYVFTIIQLSETLYDHLSWVGALQTLVLFMAVWWGWNYTAWATGWIDPSRSTVAALLGVTMILGIVTASVIPDAFTSHGQTFAETYVAMQVIRSAFVVWAFGLKVEMGRNYAQLLAWSVISGVIWVLGGFVHDPNVRLIVWAIAAILDLAAPMHGFRLPGLGATPMSRWTLAGGHLAERCQLVLMIAFGETVLRLGESYAETHATQWVDLSLVLGFILTAALWSIYFLHHAPVGAELIESADQDKTAELGRDAYAYAHMVMVGGVIVLAVAIHQAIEHPTYEVGWAYALTCLGGPIIYLVGLTMSKRYLGHGGLVHGLTGIAAFALLGGAAGFLDRVDELAIAALVAVALTVWVQLESAQERAPADSELGPGSSLP